MVISHDCRGRRGFPALPARCSAPYHGHCLRRQIPLAANIRFPDMISSLPKRPVPAWLENFRPGDELPIRDLLDDSLYYPSSGRDGDPVKYLGGFIHSFVYVDYSLKHEEVLQSIYDNHHHFSGYGIIHLREVTSELGWKPPCPSLRRRAPESCEKCTKEPFALWAILERLPDMDDSHGPKRFSLLYVCCEGVTVFRDIYLGNKKSPEVVAIIQPGTGWGGNWTDYRDPQDDLGTLVLNNPWGKPEYLFGGGWEGDDTHCCWPEYNDRIDYWRAIDGELGLWKRR